jgi:hypothetical protein
VPREIEQKHGPDCTCTRCVGFEKGNPLAIRHGAYAVVALGPRVEELADQIRELVPAYSPSDEITIRLLCLALARLERSSDVAENVPIEELGRLRQDERGWTNTARRLLNDLGMTPTSRAGLGLALVQAKGEALRAHLANKRAGAETIDAEDGS